MQIIKKKYLIIGGSSKLAPKILEHFLASGDGVALHYNRGSDDFFQLVGRLKGLGINTHTIKKDLSVLENASNLVSEAYSMLGGLNAVICLASVFERTPFGTVQVGEWNRITDVNLGATFFIVQEACKLMQDQGGSILLFSDFSALDPYKGYLPYSISKAGIDALVKGVAKIYSPKIRINAIRPYKVANGETLGKIAELVKRLLEDNETTGQILKP